MEFGHESVGGREGGPEGARRSMVSNLLRRLKIDLWCATCGAI